MITPSSTINTPRFESCSLYPYSTNEHGELVLLLRSLVQRSTHNVVYKDFGSKVRETEKTFYFSMARSFLNKTLGLGLDITNSNKNVDRDQTVKQFVKTDECIFNTQSKEIYDVLHYN